MGIYINWVQRVLLLLGLAVGCGAAMGQDKLGTTTSPATARAFTVSGKVSTVNGEPIAGAYLQIVTGTSFAGNYREFILGETTATQQGYYTLRGSLDAGKPPYMMMKIRKPGYVQLLAVLYELTTPANAEDDDVSIQRDFVLPKSAPFTGTVVTEDGTPLKDAFLTASPLDSITEGVIPDVAITTTSETGQFRLEGLAAGEFSLAVEKDGLKLLTTTGKAPASNVQLQVSMQLGTISGAVVNSEGGPVEGAEVYLQRAIEVSSSGYRADKPIQTTSDESGQFKFNDLPQGEYRLYPTAPGLIPEVIPEKAGFFKLNPGETTSGIRLVMHKGIEVKGTVTDADNGNPVAGVTLWALGVSRERLTTASDQQGEFRFSGVQPERNNIVSLHLADDSYVIESPPGKHGYRSMGHDTYFPSTTVQIKEGERTVVSDFKVVKSSEVSGVVTDENGEPLKNVVVYSGASLAPWPPGHGKNATKVVTNADGQFRVRSRPGSGQFIYAEAAGRPAVSQAVPEDADGRSSLTITAYPGSSISGIVLSEDGQPMGGVEFQVNRDGSAHLTGMPSNLPSAKGRADGTFVIEDLPGGKISLVPKKEGYFTEFHRFDLKPGEQLRGITIRLRRGLTISGKVVDEQGKPIGNARVTVDAASDDKPVFSNTVSALDGTYQLNGLPDVPINVEVWLPGKGRGELKNVKPGSEGQDIVVREEQGGTTIQIIEQ